MRFAGLCLSATLLAVSIPAGAQDVPSPMELSDRADAAAPPATETISYGPAGSLRSGELRLPAGDGPFPVAIVIHGGCWVAEMGGTGMPAFAEALRQRGIATWDIDYRRVGHAGAGWPGTFEDVAAGIDQLPELARRYPLDLTRVSAVGHSAGALFALWSAARSKLDGPLRPPAGSPRLLSAVAIDGPGSLAPLIGPDEMVCGRPVIAPLMGGTPAERPEAYRIASPSDNLPLGVQQLFVLGELAPFMTDYIAQVENSGDPVLTLSPPNANHFDIVTPGTANGEAVADWIVAHAFGKDGTR